MKTINLGETLKKLSKSKYVLLVLLLGLVMLLLPGGKSDSKSANSPPAVAAATQANALALDATGVALYAEGENLADLLSKIEGVGRCEVLMSNAGVVIVCEGANSAKVKLDVTNAAMSYTGFGSDKITVMKMK